MDETQERILNNFINTFDELDTLIETVTAEQLDWRETAGEWSIRQVLQHLTDDGNVFTFIIERALATPGCKVFFGGFPGNEVWANQLGFDQRPVTQALALMRAQNKFVVELVSAFPDRWGNQVGYYNEAGEKQVDQSVENLLVMLTEHRRDHIAMIKNILAANQ
jgi:ribosomal protein S18 acetylase RimI-like enzyme